jgi:hypothetical protein
VIAYKFLRPGAVGPFSGHRWPVPAAGKPGPWVEASGWSAVCRDGVHACPAQHLPLWIWEELWEVELDGDVEAARHKLRARRGRLVRRIEPWSSDTAKAFATACARRAAGHAADALREAGENEAARHFGDAADLQEVRGLCARLWEDLPDAVRRPVGMASDGALRAQTADASPDPYVAAHGSAVCAYIAALTAQRVAGPDALAAERTWQAVWMGRELRLAV